MSDRTPESLTDLVTPVVLRVAVTVGLLERAKQSLVVDAGLAEQLGIDPAVLVRLVRFLGAKGRLITDGRGGAEVTPLGLEIADRYAKRLDWLGAAGRMDRTFVTDCLSVVRGGLPRDLWAEFDQDADFSGSFDDLMIDRAHEWVGPVVAHPMWRDVGQVADLGGGRGHLVLALLTAWPDLRGTLVERAGPARAATEDAARRGLGDRLEVVVADLRDGVPTGPGVYLLAHVLHDWDDEAAARILGHAATAAGQSGQVVVVERVLDDPSASGRDRCATTSQDLRLLVLFGGRERTLAEFGALAESAGLALHRHSWLSSGRSMLVLRSPR